MRLLEMHTPTIVTPQYTNALRKKLPNGSDESTCGQLPHRNGCGHQTTGNVSVWDAVLKDVSTIQTNGRANIAPTMISTACFPALAPILRSVQRGRGGPARADGL